MSKRVERQTDSDSQAPAPPRRRSLLRRILLALVGIYAGLCAAGALVAMRETTMNGTDVYTTAIPVAPTDIELLFDTTGHPTNGSEPDIRQEILPAMLEMVREAGEVIVLDQFLINTFRGQGDDAPIHRDSSGELVQALVEKLKAAPDTLVLFITDPINSVYDTACPEVLQPLVRAGGHVVLTDLRQMPDSNPLYSLPFRALRPLLRRLPPLRQPVLAHPFSSVHGKIAPLQLLELLNFKANHRKVLITKRADGNWTALVASANPHTASSAHSNVAIRLAGGPLDAILDSELSIASDTILARPELLFSGNDSERLLDRLGTLRNLTLPSAPPEESTLGQPRVRYCSESATGATVQELVRQAGRGDRIEMLMFYLADPDVVRALRQAADRGAQIRMILDPNKDAFGREKSGIPNRVVATRLHDWAASQKKKVAIRWAVTQGEQAHYKALRVRLETAGTEHYLVGSANYTKRNLRGSNLESALLVENGTALADRWTEVFEMLWNGETNVRYSTDFDTYAARGTSGVWKRIVTFVTNTTGFGTY